MTEINVEKIVKLVKFATVFKFPKIKKTIAKPTTKIIATHGVSVFLDTAKKIFGKALFSAIPKIILDPLSSITSAVLKVENNAMPDKITKLFSPKICRATMASGASD